MTALMPRANATLGDALERARAWGASIEKRGACLWRKTKLVIAAPWRAARGAGAVLARVLSTEAVQDTLGRLAGWTLLAVLGSAVLASGLGMIAFAIARGIVWGMHP